MDNNTDEQKQRRHELETASTWLADAREWARLAKHLHAETEPLPNNGPSHSNKLNIAQACIASAFQLTYNALLVAEAKWPRENDGLVRAHLRLCDETRYKINQSIRNAGYDDTSNLLAHLDYYLHEYTAPQRTRYGTESTHIDEIHHINISTLPGLCEALVELFNERSAGDCVQRGCDKDLDAVLKDIRAKVNESESTDYIFRGEPERYDRVCSSLYRTYESNLSDLKSLTGELQTEMLKEAKGFGHVSNDNEVLAHIQHFGGKTNLIDFTTDYLVALFFACDRCPDEKGLIHILRKSEATASGHSVQRPPKVQNRVIAQKSIFVQPPDGFIEDDLIESIEIPRSLKEPILNYLRKHHDISTATIYNDLHGFIKYQSFHQRAYAAFIEGFKRHVDGRDRLPTNNHRAVQLFGAAIEHYGAALKLNPKFAAAYNHRGAAYSDGDNPSCAINDFSQAIDILPDYVFAYLNRGLAYYRIKEYQLSICDFNTVLKLDSNNAEAYNARGAARRGLGDLVMGVCDFTKAMNLEPSLPEPYFNRGRAYFCSGEYQSALHDFNRALELRPEWREPYFHRGLTRVHMHDVSRARTDLLKAQDLGINVPCTFCNIYPCSTDLETLFGVELPPDIVAILRGS